MTQLPSTTKDYRTSQEAVPLFSKAFPSLSFYSSFVSVVFKSGAKSKRHRYDKKEWYQSSFNLFQKFENIGCCFEITGLKHLAQLQAPYVIIANHMSTLETVILPSILLPFTDVTYIIKQSLLKYPVFRHILRAIDTIAVNRISPRQDFKTVMQEGFKRLEKNVSVIVFPQTTRMLYVDPHQFNTIGVKLAQRANVPIIPIAIKSDAWRNGKYLKDFGRIDPSKKVHFAIGKPMQVQDRGRDEHQTIVNFINRKLEEWNKG